MGALINMAATKTYRVSTWDHEDGPDGNWCIYIQGLFQWELRAYLRELYQLWDRVSMLVECEQDYARRLPSKFVITRTGERLAALSDA